MTQLFKFNLYDNNHFQITNNNIVKKINNDVTAPCFGNNIIDITENPNINNVIWKIKINKHSGFMWIGICGEPWDINKENNES